MSINMHFTSKKPVVHERSKTNSPKAVSYRNSKEVLLFTFCCCEKDNDQKKPEKEGVLVHSHSPS